MIPFYILIKRSLVSLLIAIFTILFSVYFYIIPTVAISFVSNMSEKQVIEFGNHTFNILLNEIKKEHQLTAFLGHEKSHIENRYVLKNLIRNLSGKVFTSIIFNDFNSVSTILTANAHLFSQLSYTRSLEKETDIYCMKIMQQNNLNLFKILELFQILNKKNKIEIPKYLNNHPLLKREDFVHKKNSRKTIFL